MRVIKQCWCGKCSQLELTDAEYDKYCDWRRGDCYIQDMATLNACEREFLKTGMCKQCQKEVFNNGRSERLKSARHNEIGVWA